MLGLAQPRRLSTRSSSPADVSHWAREVSLAFAVDNAVAESATEPAAATVAQLGVATLPEAFPCEQTSREGSCEIVDSQYPIDPLLEASSSTLHVESLDRSNDRQFKVQGQQLGQESRNMHEEAHCSDSSSGVAGSKRGRHEESGEDVRVDGNCASVTDQPMRYSLRKRKKTHHVPTLREGSVLGNNLPCQEESSSASDESDTSIPAAKYVEWALGSTVLKRVFVDGRAIFQLQFEWPLGMPEQRRSRKPSCRSVATRKRGVAPGRTTKGYARFTPSEDALLIKLKETEGFPWSQIHREFSKSFPKRTRGSLQVRYSTKLKDRG